MNEGALSYDWQLAAYNLQLRLFDGFIIDSLRSHSFTQHGSVLPVFSLFRACLDCSLGLPAQHTSFAGGVNPEDTPQEREAHREQASIRREHRVVRRRAGPVPSPTPTTSQLMAPSHSQSQPACQHSHSGAQGDEDRGYFFCRLRQLPRPSASHRQTHRQQLSVIKLLYIDSETPE